MKACIQHQRLLKPSLLTFQKHYFDSKETVQDVQGRKYTETGKRDSIFQHKVSYATPLLVLLQVTNCCILISMQLEQERGGKKEIIYMF